MNGIVKFFSRLLEDDGFYRFHKAIAGNMYAALDAGFTKGENEVALVTGLVNSINGQRYNGITIRAKKIHGSRSQVEFKHRSVVDRKELADASS